MAPASALMNTTYFAQSCSPAAVTTNAYLTACQTVGDASKVYDSAAYETLAEYQAASTKLYIAGSDGEGSYSLDLYWNTVYLETFHQWQSAVATIAWDQDPGQLENIMILESRTPDYIESLPSDLRSYVVSAYLPQFTTTMTYHEVAVQRSTPASMISSVPITAADLSPGVNGSPSTMMPSASTSSNPSWSADTSSWSTRKLVAIALPISLTLVLCICLAILALRRRRHRLCGHATPPRDYNAEPLFPHKPLASLSSTSFATESGPRHGSVSRSHSDAPHLPMLPELEGFHTEPVEMPASASSSDYLPELSASNFDDPFSDRAVLPRSRQATPGVSPSSYPLRDRLNHDTLRRRYAIDRTIQGSSKGISRRRPKSVSEQELETMAAFFKTTDPDDGNHRSLRTSRSLEGIRQPVARKTTGL